MFQNYLAAALRNLARNRLYATINIIGLVIGFAAALLIALFVRDECSYDKWIPQHEAVYRISQTFRVPGGPPDVWDEMLGHARDWLRSDFPQIEIVARLDGASRPQKPISVRHGDKEFNEPHVYWGDPDIFEILQLPTIAGNLHAALRRPDGVVITRTIARKYFGRDAPIGETLELERRHLLTVTAVLEDLPSNTHLDLEIVASGLAPYSGLAELDASPTRNGSTYTYLRLKPGAAIAEIRAALPEFIDRHSPPLSATSGKASDNWSGQIAPIADIHLRQTSWDAMKPGGDLNVVYAVSAIGILIVLIAAINFVNLMTARASRRLIEIGIRKVSGAERRDLVLQFVGESLIYAALGMTTALLITVAALPAFNGQIGRTIVFDFWRTPSLIGWILIAVTVIGVTAGMYPAAVLSALRPASALKAGSVRAFARARVRHGLVIVQFAALIGLMAGTVIIWQQTSFAMTNSLRFEKDQLLLVRTSCSETLKDEIQKLNGVTMAACSHGLFADDRFFNSLETPDGSSVALWPLAIDFDFFATYGIQPLAGRVFAIGQDTPATLSNSRLWSNTVVISKAAMQKLGFSAPEVAVGRPLPLGSHPLIIGVVDDYSLDSVRTASLPTVYSLGHGEPLDFRLLSVKLTGRQIPETLDAIDRVWNQIGERAGPIERFFVDQHIQSLYADLVREMKLFAAVAGLAFFIAALSLFGLSAFTAETRTKEIGLRKTLGASKADILRLLLWEFTKPVLWANVIAWPVTYFIMRHWLEGFAYHIGLTPWVFLAASALALLIAVVTVTGHAIIVARTQPVTALRYE